jgi:hypothetical protein
MSNIVELYDKDPYIEDIKKGDIVTILGARDTHRTRGIEIGDTFTVLKITHTNNPCGSLHNDPDCFNYGYGFSLTNDKIGFAHGCDILLGDSRGRRYQHRSGVKL